MKALPFAFLLALPALVKGGFVQSENPVCLEQITVAGDLSYQVPLTRLAISPDLIFEFTVEHALHSTIDGVVRSLWRIKALETGLYPAGPSRVIWRQLGGRSIVFRRPAESELTYSEGWGIAQLSADVCKLSQEGLSLLYTRGQLTELAQRRGARFLAESHGSRLVALTDPFSGNELFRASFRADGQPGSLIVGPEIFSFNYSPEGELVSLHNSAGTVLLRATYIHSLIASVASSGPAHKVTWQRQPAHTRGDSLLRHPVRLETFGAVEFSYSIRGDVVLLERLFAGARRSLHWNMRTGQSVELPLPAD